MQNKIQIFLANSNLVYLLTNCGLFFVEQKKDTWLHWFLLLRQVGISFQTEIYFKLRFTCLESCLKNLF